MELPLVFQGSQFLFSLLLGLIYGLLYDFLRGLRQNVKALTHFLDFLFVLTVLLGNLLFALYLGGGEYRIFMLLATFLGAFLYFITLRRLFFPIFVFFWKILTFPFQKIWGFLGRKVKKLGFFIKNLFSRGKKSVIIKRQHRKNFTKERQEGSNVASVQIKTHYQADFAGSDDLRTGHHRKPAAEN